MAVEPLIGAHVSVAGGVPKAYERALVIGATAMQIFVKSNMQWFAPSPLADEEVRAFLEHSARDRVRSVFAHSGYMINLAAANPEFLEKSRRALKEELLRADRLGLPFLVLHPGAHMGAGVEAGLRRVVESLDAVFEGIPGVRTKVALETTAGQGSCLGSRFEELAYLLQNAREPERLCVCVDTAHIFAAGYDIGSEAGAKKVFAEFHRVVGREWLAAFHLNDSKAALGSRVDRHEHIAQGKIGPGAFGFIMRHAAFAGIPKVLETPKGREMREDIENLERLRAMLRCS